MPELMSFNTGINMTLEIIRQLAKGKYLRVEGQRYPLAMGVDGSIGYLYNEDRVVSEFTFSQLVEIVRNHNIYPIPD